MRNLQQAVVTFLAKNPYHDGHSERDNRNTREPPLHGYNNRNRPPVNDENGSDNDEYEEDVHGQYRGSIRENASDNQEYQMKMELPSFNGDVITKEFLDWVIEVERLFAYIETSEDK